ncbi:hypothetical protein [Saprospira grandis]|uniref:Uncharacterized protein n=1 Tax=Saprospira grandis (strain Lewin) TaxID=984262 RepID=H6L8K1_SAPGL|nr:hypothetical protein [Saprospira grandis]AFC26726.1 hypothetical protein SGRA_4011 [Saprospira grandis str. Lewin]
MITITNGFLQPYIKDLTPLATYRSKFFKYFLQAHHIPVRTDDLIDWEHLGQEYYTFDVETDEDWVTARLKETELSEYPELIVEMGYGKPICKVKTSTFIAHWYDFYGASGYQGISAVSLNLKYLIELRHDTGLFYSNFKIDPDS